MKSSKTRMLTEGAAMVAMAFILSYIRPFKFLPFGGSITLLSMLPIVVYSIKYGVGRGLVVSFVYSLLQLFQGISEGLLGWGLTGFILGVCMFCDYIGAFSVLGFAGIFRNYRFPHKRKKEETSGSKMPGYLAGIALVITCRFLFHFVSGFAIWKSAGELWEGLTIASPVLYSLIYNGLYMIPELIFTLLAAFFLFLSPQMKRVLSEAE